MYYAWKKLHSPAEIGAKMVTFFRAYKCIVQNLQTLQDYIFRILQHFGAKLWNPTNPTILVLAVVKYFVLLAKVEC